MSNFELVSCTIFGYYSQSSNKGNKKYNFPNQNKFYSKGDIYSNSKTLIKTKGLI